MFDQILFIYIFFVENIAPPQILNVSTCLWYMYILVCAMYVCFMLFFLHVLNVEPIVTCAVICILWKL